MSDFVKVADVSEIAAVSKTYFEVEERLVVLFRVNDEFFCIDDVCTHDGGPLGEGQFDGIAIACPRHGAKFDIRTGKALTMPATEATVVHQVKIEGESLFVKISD